MSPVQWPSMARIASTSMAVATLFFATGAWVHSHSMVKTALVFLSGGVVAITSRMWSDLLPLWTKRASSLIDRSLSIRFSGFQSRYAAYLVNRFGVLDQNGFQSLDNLVRDLEDVYVDLLVEDAPAAAISHDPIGYSQAGPGGGFRLSELLHLDPDRRRNFALLGPPGSGKSTLLRHLAIVSRKADSPLKLVPFYLKLQDLAATIKTAANLTLAELIENDLKALKPPEGWWERKLEQGECLVMLDGLDEVGDLNAVKSWVEKQIALYGNSRFLITSRPDAYRSISLAGFSSLRVLPLTPRQMKALVLNWYGSGSAKGRGSANSPTAADLLNRISLDATLQELAVNPLLLTLITILHASGNRIPERRTELLRAICEVSLERRKDQGISGIKLRTRDTIAILCVLAYRMSCMEIEEISEDDAEKIVGECLQSTQDSLRAIDFLRLMHETSGIFIERELHRFAFCHRLFREYLTAVYVQEKHLGGELVTRVSDPFWRETVRLYCALDDATAVIRECLSSPQPSAEQILLAAECLSEAKCVSEDARRLVSAVTVDALEDGDLKRRKLAAELLLIRRFQSTGPAAPGGAVDLSPITFAEYQLFIDSGRAKGENFAPDHWNEWEFDRGTGRLPMVGAGVGDARAFCQWLELGAGAGFRVSLAAPQEVAHLLEADPNLRRLRALTDEAAGADAVLPGAEIFRQIEQDAREITAGEELTRPIARLHQRLIWFAVWYTLSRNRDGKTDERSVGLELSLAFDDLLDHRATRYLDRSSPLTLSRDLEQGSASEYEPDYRRLRFQIEPVDVFAAHPDARAWDLDLRINQNQDRAIAKASVQEFDRLHSAVRAAHILNWLCVTEKRSRGELPVKDVIWIKKSKIAFSFD